MHAALPVSLSNPHHLADVRQTGFGKALLVVGATALVALSAHVSIPLWFTPVPLTLQPMAVLLVGLALGPVLGFSAMVLYLAEGAAGLPVFTPQGLGGVAQLLGPTGGFLLCYPLVAATAGALVRALAKMFSRFAAAAAASAVATALLFAIGASWLAHLLHLNATMAWHLAVRPFLPGEAIKIAAAAGLYASLGRSTSHRP